MSPVALTRSALFLRPLQTTSPSILSLNAIKCFTTSSTRQALKEGDANRDKEHISETYERVKNDNLRSAKEGKGSWKSELASESEASVKADRDETGVTHEGVKNNDTKGGK